MNNQMPWPSVTLSEIANDVTVGFVGPMTQEYRTEGVTFLRSKNVKPFSIDLKDIRYIDQNFHKKLRKSRLTPGDVIIVRTGTPGITAVIPEWLQEANCSDLVIVRPAKILNPFYFSYFMNSVAAHYVDAYTVGAVQQHFNVASAKKIKIPLPDISEQEQIVEVLGALDDKIELNRQMNHTLEQMAQALFKSWFVDFYPVVAKAAGKKPYGMSDEVAALFPDRFVESELGMIPEGWRVGKVSELGEIICGKTPSTKILVNFGKEIPFITIPDMHGKIFISKTQRYLSRLGANTQIKKYLPPKSTCVSCIATPGLVSLTTENSQSNQQINSVIPSKPNVEFFNFWTLKFLGDEIRAGGSGGTVFHNLNRTNFSLIKILLPRNDLVFAFNKTVKHFMTLLSQNQNETEILSSIRDTLLPKLLSGQIRLKQAEKAVGEVV